MKYFSLLTVLLIFFACQTESESQTVSKTPVVNDDLVNDDGLHMVYLNIPEGFKLSVYGRVEEARSMAMGDKGTLFVGNRRKDKVYAVRDIDGDFRIDEKYVIMKDGKLPNGVAFRDGDLYVAEVNKLWVFPDIEDNLENPKRELIYDDYPTDRHHGWKFIAFGPDGKLYVPVGAPCNICESKNEMYASITRMDPDGSNREVYVHGVRNTVGFTWHPETGEMWFTDNGRDMMGDEIPPCELNKVSKAGEHFGYPYWHGRDIKDPEFGDKYPRANFVEPAQNLGPHVAPLGLKFYTGNMFPEMYKNMIFIAEHGSWNRTADAGHTGHQITVVKEEDGKGVSYETFIDGFLIKETNRAWGRPVDILQLDDGSMLISDDKGGAIYRLSYEG